MLSMEAGLYKLSAKLVGELERTDAGADWGPWLEKHGAEFIAIAKGRALGDIGPNDVIGKVAGLVRDFDDVTFRRVLLSRLTTLIRRFAGG